MADVNPSPRLRPTILVADPGGLYAGRATEINTAIAETLRGGRYILGPAVEAFEREFAARFGFRHAIGTANGTDAIELCLRALCLPAGGRVAVPALTAAATAAAVVRAGYEPVFVDIDPDSFLIDPDALHATCAAARDRSIMAVIPVHLYGRPCAMADVTAVAEEFGLAVVEDCSQAHGATIDGGSIGHFGKAAAFSCYPTKNLGALGDAGVAGAIDDAVADRIRLLQQYGWRRRQVSDEVGMNSRLDDLQASILRVQLRHLDADNDLRAQIARRYTADLTGVSVPAVVAGHVYHQYTIRCGEGSLRRDSLADHLARHGIMTNVLYPVPLHKQPAYAAFHNPRLSACPRAEAACSQILCLPMHPSLTDAEVERVIAAVNEFPPGAELEKAIRCRN